MPGLDDKISNIIGTKIPNRILKQLYLRSEKGSNYYRDTSNLVYLANKSAWVRLVSSINLGQEDIRYFRNRGLPNIFRPEDLAKNYVLFGGTSKYLQLEDKTFKYDLRSGIGMDGSYGMLGENEIKEYGYRPMPGLSEVIIETQGRLGSVRSANIQFRCWDKDQLDIMDALYFKLGFSMFLEWGHTVYYKSTDPNTLQYSELYSIDPFEANLSKETIQEKIAKNNRETEGNYDAMLGIVTNFNYSYNQEGGFDCTLKLMSLGILGDSIKINNTGVLPEILKEEIKLYTDTLSLIEKQRKAEEARQNAANNPTVTTIPPPANFKDLQNLASSSADYSFFYPSNKQKNKENENFYFIRTDPNIPVIGIKNINGQMPAGSNDYVENTKIKIDGNKIFTYLPKLYDHLNTEKNWSGGVDVDVDFTPKDFFSNIIDKLSSGKTFSEKVANLAEFAIPVWGAVKSVSKLIEVDISRTYASTYSYISRDNGNTYGIRMIANKKAVIDQNYLNNQGITDVYYIIDEEKVSVNLLTVPTKVFATKVKEYLLQPDTMYNVVSVLDETISYNASLVNNKKNIKPGEKGRSITVRFFIPYEKEYYVSFKKVTNPVTGEQTSVADSRKSIKFTQEVVMIFEDTYFISEIASSNLKQPEDYLSNQKTIQDQNQTQVQESPPPAEEQSLTPEQIANSMSSQSSLELTLKSIQLHALNKAINRTQGSPDLSIGKLVYKSNIWDPKDTSNGKTFYSQIFSKGVFTNFIDQLISNPVQGSKEYNEYIQKETPGDYSRLLVQSYYGFASAIMKNKLDEENIKLLTPVDFKELLTAYVVPYEISQEIAKGTQVNHPVYIPFGFLLMILNHCSIVYDKNDEKQEKIVKPLVYIDFNPNHNFCLSNPKQITTNPFKILIPCEGTQEDFSTLFDPSVLNTDKKSIKPTDGSTESQPLFLSQPGDDRLSSQIPAFRFEIKSDSNATNTTAYRGKIMNILLSIDYIINLIHEYSNQEDYNNVYLKQFLDKIVEDINKFTGNFNFFRVSYNDFANTYQIVDDQLTPPATSNEEIISPIPRTKGLDGEQASSTLPLVGTKSIAKSLSITTNVSSKLSNMIAISANANVEDKSVLSSQSDNFGFINTKLKDRYITNRTQVSSNNTKKEEINKEKTDTLIAAAAQFNSTIRDFYSSINPSEANVSQATNYYIEKLTKVKNSELATRASAMLPITVDFTTDGISGVSMGQAFTIPKELLPYTYNERSLQDQPGLDSSRDHKVGFFIVGLTHNISENTWNTNIKANMTFLKNITDFSGSVQELRKEALSFIGEEISTDFIITTGTSGQIPDNVSGCPRKKGTLDEEIITSTIVKDQYGGYVKGKKTFIAKLEEAHKVLQAKGITMRIGDSLRSFEFQKSSYENYLKNVQLQKQGLSWVKNNKTYPPTQKPDNIAHPCKGYHVLGQAIDLEQTEAQRKDIVNQGPIYQALYNAGLRRIPNEWWHWSIGEVS